MAAKKHSQHSTESIQKKSSRHCDLEETMKIVQKWGEDNIQERQKSYTRFV